MPTSDIEGERIINFLDENFLLQKLNKLTRGSNILDLITCSDDDLINNLDIGEQFSTSDHYIIRFNINANQTKTLSSVQIPDYRKANFDNIRKELAKINLSSVLEDCDVNALLIKLKDLLETTIKENIPMKKRRKDKQKINGWIE